MTPHTLIPHPGTHTLEKFLVLTSQLEQLKVEWGLKVLNCHSISTRHLAKDLDAIYKERVLRVARKAVAKMQMRELVRKQAEEVRGTESRGTLMCMHMSHVTCILVCVCNVPISVILPVPLSPVDSSTCQ